MWYNLENENSDVIMLLRHRGACLFDMGECPLV